MKITGILWLEDIVEKLQRKHHIKKHEVKEIFQNKPVFRFIEKGHRKGENVYVAPGQTDAGRYLVVYFVYKTTRQALIVSARDMTIAERRKYAQS
jgi:uncharacterized protein